MYLIIVLYGSPYQLNLNYIWLFLTGFWNPDGWIGYLCELNMSLASQICLLAEVNLWVVCTRQLLLDHILGLQDSYPVGFDNWSNFMYFPRSPRQYPPPPLLLAIPPPDLPAATKITEIWSFHKNQWWFQNSKMAAKFVKLLVDAHQWTLLSLSLKCCHNLIQNDWYQENPIWLPNSKMAAKIWKFSVVSHLWRLPDLSLKFGTNLTQSDWNMAISRKSKMASKIQDGRQH